MTVGWLTVTTFIKAKSIGGALRKFVKVYDTHTMFNDKVSIDIKEVATV